MKGTIEIVIRKNEGGKLRTEVKAHGCETEDILTAAQMGFISLVMNAVDGVPEHLHKQMAKEFGEMMESQLLEMLQNAKVRRTDFAGKEEAFLRELLKRQGEVQEG